MPRRPADPITLDHAAIVDAQMALDAAQVAAKGHGFIRLAVEHELCQPGNPCTTWPTMVVVVPIAPGVRMRWPIAVPEAAA